MSKVYSNIKCGFCLLILYSSACFASDLKGVKENNFFLTFKAGEVFPTPIYGNTGLNSGKNTYIFGVLIGKTLNDFFSLDIEYNHRDNNDIQTIQLNDNYPTTWSMKSDMLSMNMSVNLIKESPIIPFIRLGGGVANNSSGSYVSHDDDTSSSSNFPGKKNTQSAWQIGGGFKFKLNSTFTTQFEYMYVDRGTVETQSYFYDEAGDKVSFTSKKGDFVDHQLTFGITYRF